MKKILAFIFTSLLTISVFAESQSFFTLDTHFENPVFGSQNLYSSTFGDSMSVNFKFTFAQKEENLFRFGLCINDLMVPVLGKEKDEYNFMTVMPLISLYYPITPRFNIHTDLMFSFCAPELKAYDATGNYTKTTFSFTPFFEADVVAGIYLSPSFILEGSVGYKHVNGYYDGISASLGLSWALKKSFKKLNIERIDAISILPVFYEYYKENPVFKINLTNNDRFTIREVKVVLSSTAYSKRLSKKFDIYLEPGDSAELQIPFSLKDKILDFNKVHTEQINLTISYKAGSKRVKSKAVSTFTVYGKNNFIWQTEVEDNMMYNDLLTSADGKVSVFVNPNDLTSIAISHRIMNYKSANEDFDDLPYNLKAIYKILSYVQSKGIEYQVDPNSLLYGETDIPVDYIKFPIETLSEKHGDCDDLSVLFAQLLESAGVKCAFITIPGHIYIAADSGMKEKQINSLFGNDLLFIEHKGTYYIPLEVTMLESGFEKVWTFGMNEWVENEETRDFFPLEESWKKFKPASYKEWKNITQFFPNKDFEVFQEIAKDDLTKIVLSNEDDYIALSKREYILGDLEAAYNHMIKALEEHPTASNFYNAALIAYRMNNIEDATLLLTQGAEINSNLKGKSLYKKLIIEEAETENNELLNIFKKEDNRSSKQEENLKWDDSDF